MLVGERERNDHHGPTFKDPHRPPHLPAIATLRALKRALRDAPRPPAWPSLGLSAPIRRTQTTQDHPAPAPGHPAPALESWPGTSWSIGSRSASRLASVPPGITEVIPVYSLITSLGSREIVTNTPKDPVWRPQDEGLSHEPWIDTDCAPDGERTRVGHLLRGHAVRERSRRRRALRTLRNPTERGGHPLCPVSYTHLRAHETRHDLVC